MAVCAFSTFMGKNECHIWISMQMLTLYIYILSESALALYDDNEKENAQTINHKLCHRFTLRINKQYFTSLKLRFGILVHIF